MHVERARRGGNVSGIFPKNFLNVLPFQSVHRQRLRTQRRGCIAQIAAERRDDFFRIRWFWQGMSRSQLDGFHCGGRTGKTGQHDDAHVGVALPQAFDQRQSRSTWNSQVNNREIVPLSLDGDKSVAKIPRRVDTESAAGERASEHMDKNRVVIHRQKTPASGRNSVHVAAIRASGTLIRVHPPPPSRFNRDHAATQTFDGGVGQKQTDTVP